jgi:hypothetical protein
MTTIISDHGLVARTTPAAASRIWKVVRLNLVNRSSTIWVPTMILGFIWLVNYAIWWIIYSSSSPADRSHSVQNTQYSGGEFYIFIYMLVLAIQIIAITFPFALGFSVTRRDFYLGSALTFLILAAAYSVGLTFLGYVEQWTNGWGLGGHLFTAVYFGSGTFWQRLFVIFVGLLFCMFVGGASATIFMRWRVNGLIIAGAILAVLVVGAVALITWTQSWPAVGRWFINEGSFGVVAWLLIPAAIAGLAGFFVLRRATPKS